MEGELKKESSMEGEIDLKEKRKRLVEGVKGLFSKVKSGLSEESSGDEADFDLEERKKQFLNFFKGKKEWLVYVVLGVVIWFGSYIRVQNLYLLKDTTTGKYIPLALDPHIFLKYVRYILEHGSLVAQDMTRFVPQGAGTKPYVFMSYFIVYLYKIIHFFVPSVTPEFVHVIYPVVCFALAILFFFLLVKRLFNIKVALLASLFLSIVPAFLHRTMAGFSDHEALGTLLMFMAMYFYVLGWQSKKLRGSLGWGLLAGIFTGFMGLSWGGWKFLLLIISLFVLVEFFLDKLAKKDIYQYFAWFIGFVYITAVWMPQLSLNELPNSFTTLTSLLVLFMLFVDLILFKYDFLKIKNKVKGKVPLSVVSLLVSFVIGISALAIVLGPGILFTQVEEISDSLLHPMGNDRWQLTVAEQHQPYFTDWMGHFGPIFYDVPIYLFFFMGGSTILFYLMVKKIKRKFLLTGVYLCFILAFILSRYSPSSLFNGTSFISKSVYLGSLGIFAVLAAFFYFKSFYKDKETYKKILDIDKKYIFVLIWFLIMVVAARGAARLIYIFTPVTAVLAAFGMIWLSDFFWRIKQSWCKYLGVAILFLILLSPFSYPVKGMVPYFSKQSLDEGKYTGPGYNQQWQIAGEWARENTPEDAVFGHWWDYGYWVQGGFQRATVLDGANKNKYWNHLMGRHVLCGQSQTEALEFLKVHDVTHYLIVSDEIGKYTAYSSIGSDQNHDRYSWISTFRMDEQATQEAEEGMAFVYNGGYTLDDDFVWEGVTYPRGAAGIGGIFLPVKEKKEIVNGETVGGLEIHQPSAALFYQGKRVDLPLECVYFNGEMLKFDEPGLKGCFRLIPTLNDQGQPSSMFGAGMYVSEEGMNALWTNLYVFEQNNPDYDTSAFKSIYSDAYVSTIAFFRGRLIGPIKIWEVEYPEGFEVSEETTKRYLGGSEFLEEWFFDVN